MDLTALWILGAVIIIVIIGFGEKMKTNTKHEQLRAIGRPATLGYMNTNKVNDYGEFFGPLVSDPNLRKSDD